MSSSSIEQVIAVASRFKEHVMGLYDAYAALPLVIEKEHDAIRTSQFVAVEASRLEKEVAGERIELHFNALTKVSEQLGDLQNQFLQDPGKRPQSMREALGVFLMLAGAADANDFAHSVLQHLVDGLTKLVADFEKLYFEVKPVIEGNKYLVTTMLKNFQESYRFWQDVSEKVQASYNSQGVQSTAGKASGFAIKA